MVATATSAHANGLADLKSALARQNGPAPIKGALEVESWNRQGLGDDATEENGQIKIDLEMSMQGLQLRYAPDVLGRISTEQIEKESNPKARTPTVSGLNAVTIREIQGMTAASDALSRLLDRSTFGSEREENWNGKPAHLLTFELGLGNLSQRDRKYIKKHEGRLDIWIGADGTPLASRYHQGISGRAFLVVSFETTVDDESTYSLAGNRLIAIHKQVISKGSGAGEGGETRVTMNLQLGH